MILPLKLTSFAAHNCWYSTLGVAQWTAWECVFMHIFATDRLPHIKDHEAFATWDNVVRMLFWTAAIPIFRGTANCYINANSFSRFFFC